MKYNKNKNEWEDVGNLIIGKNVVIADGAKILGPIIIGENSVIGTGAIVTKNMPDNSIIYGVNRFKHKNLNYDLVFNSNMIDFRKIIETNNKLIEKYNNKNNGVRPNIRIWALCNGLDTAHNKRFALRRSSGLASARPIHKQPSRHSVIVVREIYIFERVWHIISIN